MNPLIALILGQESSGGNIFGLLLPLLLLGPLVYFMIVPQRKERQRHSSFIDQIDVGDAVVSSGGLHGTITFIEDDIVHLEIDTDVVIRLSKASLARMEVEPEESDSEPTPADK